MYKKMINAMVERNFYEEFGRLGKVTDGKMEDGYYTFSFNDYEKHVTYKGYVTETGAINMAQITKEGYYKKDENGAVIFIMKAGRKC